MGDTSNSTEHVDTTLWKRWCICDLKSCIMCVAASVFKWVLYLYSCSGLCNYKTCYVKESQIKMYVCFQSKVDYGLLNFLNFCQCYLWSMVWSRRRWSLHWGPAVTETLPSYTNPQSEGSLGWVTGLLPLVCCQQGVLKVWREYKGVFWCRLAAVVVVGLQ